MMKQYYFWCLWLASCGSPGFSLGSTSPSGATTMASSNSPTSGSNSAGNPNDPNSSPSDPNVNCAKLTYSNFAANFLAQNCTSCHSQDGNTMPFLSTYAQVTAALSLVGAAISNNQMPPNISLNPNVVVQIMQWVQCGGPQ